jgi:hypothetical protein
MLNPMIVIDRLLRKAQGVHAFDSHPRCIVHISICPWSKDVPESGVKRGDEVVVVHLDNERLPALHAGVSSADFPRLLLGEFHWGLKRLARHILESPELDGVVACRGAMSCKRPENYAVGLSAMGFDVRPMEHSGLRSLLPFYSSLLSRALHGYGSTELKRIEFWMPRERLLQMVTAEPAGTS